MVNNNQRPISHRNHTTTHGNDSISFFQLNLARDPRALDNLLSCKFDIALICEPPTGKQGLVLATPNYTCFQKKTSDKVKAAILVSKSYEGLLLSESNSNNVFVDFEFQSRRLTLASIYFEPNGEIEEQTPTLSDFLEQNTGHIIVGGDFNGHSTTWNSPTTNSRGEAIDTLLSANNLHLQNTDNTKPTYKPSYRPGVETIVDLTATSSGVVEFISDWHVSDKVTLSDHQAIRFNLLGHRQSNDEECEGYNMKKCN